MKTVNQQYLMINYELLRVHVQMYRVNLRKKNGTGTSCTCTFFFMCTEAVGRAEGDNNNNNVSDAWELVGMHLKISCFLRIIHQQDKKT